MQKDYITFVVKNMLPQSTQLSGPALPGALFTDTYMSLTYKITANTAVTSDVPVRDVFKILTKEDLGVGTPGALANLVPRYFKDLDGRTKLGINLGTSQRSIKVFNLSPLSIILDGKDESHRNYSIKFRTIDNRQTTQFKVADFFEDPGKVDPNKPSEPTKGSSILTVIFIICIVVVLAGLGVIAFFMSKKKQPAPVSDLEEPIKEDGERTMKLPDETDTHENDDSKL